MSQRTFVLLKPEAIAARQVGEIVARIEKEGFLIKAMKLARTTKTQAEKLYEMHLGKGFYGDLIGHILSGPILPMILEAPDAVARMRKLIGPTNPSQADRTTIRGQYGQSVTRNTIHAADSPENVTRESQIFFSPEDIS